MHGKENLVLGIFGVDADGNTGEKIFKNIKYSLSPRIIINGSVAHFSNF